jgi:sialic acid synthase SpsE
LGDCGVGERQPLFVIAELGLNHGGSIDRALEMVDAAAAAGASAVKLQTFKAEDLVAASCPAPVHVTADSLRDFFREFELDRDAHIEVARRARLHGLAFMSTPFSIAAVNMLDEIGVDGFKIASGDLTFDSLIARCARTELPLFMSTGMATLAETAHAVALARGSGARGSGVDALRLVLSGAERQPEPARHPDARPGVRTTVGLSDHASSIAALPVAVTLGATIYERHLMLPGDDCIDAAVSSTPHSLPRS